MKINSFMPRGSAPKPGGLKPYCFGTNIHRMFSKALATPRPLAFVRSEHGVGRRSDERMKYCMEFTSYS